MTDKNTPLSELKQLVEQFTQDRDWDQFYDAQSISTALSIEANELMELFVWARKSEIEGIISQKRQAVEFELADVLFTTLLFCNKYNIDLTEALLKKLEHNAQKYPIHKAYGNNKKYSEL